MSCVGLKGEARKKCLEKGIKYTMLEQAKNANAKAKKVYLNSKAAAVTKKDSSDYKQGYRLGRQKGKPTAKSHPYGENEHQKFGRWEGQNSK
jgi:hypothetical protein